MIYFDNAATTFPKPEAVWLKVKQCGTQYCGNPGRSGHYYSVKTGTEVMNTRERIAELLEAENAMQILFTSNATEALNIGLWGALKKGDHVVTTSMEHNSVLRPLKAMEQEGICFTVVKGNREGVVSPEAVEQAIEENTKMIVCTHGSNVCGAIQNINEIGKVAKRKKVLYFIDASQTLGSIPLNVKESGAHLVAAPGHKGLFGPQGTGFLYMDPELTGKLKPLKQGGTGTASKSLQQPRELPEAYESGTVNAPGIIGLGAGLDWIRTVGSGSYREGISVIGAWEKELTAQLDEAIRNMKGIVVYGPDVEKKTGITAWNFINRNCEETAALLWKRYGIAVRAGYHCAGLAHKTLGTWETGAIRVSVGPFNTKREVKKLIQAIYQLGKKDE